MSSFTFFGILLCFNACLLQNAFGQCYPGGHGYETRNIECGGGRGYGYGNGPGTGYGWNTAEAAGAYGGAGVGDLDVAGELPVAGTTIVAGQVPILGAVQFAGEVPAAGVVTIYGRCDCDCNGTPLYQ